MRTPHPQSFIPETAELKATPAQSWVWLTNELPKPLCSFDSQHCGGWWKPVCRGRSWKSPELKLSSCTVGAIGARSDLVTGCSSVSLTALSSPSNHLFFREVTLLALACEVGGGRSEAGRLTQGSLLNPLTKFLLVLSRGFPWDPPTPTALKWLS